MKAAERLKQLQPDKEPCSNCGQELVTTVPFISDKWIGLESPECPCGDGDSIAVAIGRDEITQAEMDAMFSDLNALVKTN